METNEIVLTGHINGRDVVLTCRFCRVCGKILEGQQELYCSRKCLNVQGQRNWRQRHPKKP
jgi:predicted nucleic acid-binding Zn ribbon protein